MLGNLDFATLIESLPCSLQLPAAWADFFQANGPLRPAFDDLRQFPRAHCRTKAVLAFEPSLPNLERDSAMHCVYVKDVSQNSVGFLHSEQLFPKELIRLVTADEKIYRLAVVRCRRVQDYCYEIAARTPEPAAKSPS